MADLQITELRLDGGLGGAVRSGECALEVVAMAEGLELLRLNGQGVDLAEDTRAHINTFLAEGI